MVLAYTEFAQQFLLYSHLVAEQLGLLCWHVVGVGRAEILHFHVTAQAASSKMKTFKETRYFLGATDVLSTVTDTKVRLLSSSQSLGADDI